MSIDNVAGKVGNFNLVFRQQSLSNHSGLLLIKEFIDTLAIPHFINDEMKVKSRQRGYTEAEAIMGLVYNIIAGGECLNDLNVLRGDTGTKHLIGVEQLLAPTTAGEHLRKFTIGDIHDLIRINKIVQQRVQSQQDCKVVTLDMDSSIYEQASMKKEGSNKAYNGEIGYHPLFCFWEETGQLIHSHLRRGSAYTASKAVWFMNEVINRVPAQADRRLRADSGFYSCEVVQYCEAERIKFGITADQTKPLMQIIEAIEEDGWKDLEKYGVAQVSEVRYKPVGWNKQYRYVVKRDLQQNKFGELYFRYHVLVTNDEETAAADVLEWQLQHANMENRIKEHKRGFNLEKLPTMKFHANWAYLLIGQIAYNIMSWFKRMVLPEKYHKSTIKSIRHQIINVAGKIVKTGRKVYLMLNEEYKYKEAWEYAMKRLDTLSFA